MPGPIRVCGHVDDHVCCRFTERPCHGSSQVGDCGNTAAMAPLLPAMPEIPLFSFNGLLITVQQVLIGVAIGFASQLLSLTFILAGQVIAMQTSLGFASLVDPINGGSTPVVGQFYLMLGTLVFFAVDGHLTAVASADDELYHFTCLDSGALLDQPTSPMRIHDCHVADGTVGIPSGDCCYVAD